LHTVWSCRDETTIQTQLLFIPIKGMTEMEYVSEQQRPAIDRPPVTLLDDVCLSCDNIAVVYLGSWNSGSAQDLAVCAMPCAPTASSSWL